MSFAAAPLLLSPAQVNEITKSGGQPVSILDSTWFMPNSPRNAKLEFLDKRIPKSQFLDLDEVASSSELGLKHMMPDRQTFAHACGRLGISPSTHVIIYDAHGVFSAPRALFMFRSFGHKNSSIIDGGLPRWIDEGMPVETSSPADLQPTEYSLPEFDEKSIRSYDEIVSNSQFDPAAEAKSEIVLDARPKGRFNGSDPEPRAGLSSGHIPHSFSLTFSLFLDKHTTKDGKEYTTFLPPSEIRKALESAVGPAEAHKIIQGERSVVTSCGSGMTAGVLWLGLQLLGVKKVGLYDESWTGYAMRPSSVIQK
ncbi:putative 3-mercaptopyruvate sulfurtransferase [Psilocybe cubensis]|uniref:Rhodanese domain-containing protein n=2 Tax=Psilocybe cubensis TaxID=181762 RepID=A0A8H8CR33_PSICU|nr:putative 3-mercaptopyruvate sulfurtransferase [Psilocybe cubensis]KAH9487154.1 putative 3-mercaptopyruvate sulfurtransferase [Psilocybe cubensis]